MAEPQTVNCGIIVPNTGDLVGTWGSAALNPDFVAVDGYLGGVQTVSASNVSFILTSPAGFTPTPSAGPTQAQNAVLRVTGTLTGNVQITLPLPGYMIVENLTTGNFLLYLSGATSTEIIAIDQGTVQHVYNDGSHVRFVNLPPVGTYLDICDATVPSWITACSKPPYLLCDGSTFSAVTYPYLNAKLGGNTLPDLRGVARYTLNQGTARLTTSGSGLDGNTRFSLKTTQSYTIVTSNLPPYTPSGTIALTPNNSYAGAVAANNVLAGSTAIGVISVFNPVAVFTGAAQGGTSTPFGVVGPGTISGITLIRAA